MPMLEITEETHEMNAKAIIDLDSVSAVSLQRSEQVSRLDVFVNGQIMSFVGDTSSPEMREKLSGIYDIIFSHLKSRDDTHDWVR